MISSVTLNNGAKMPIVGIGTWRADQGKATEVVKVAIRAGYRHIYGAYVYQNEKDVGVGIRAVIDEGLVKREDLFIVSKLWCTCHIPSLVRGPCEKSLSDLKLDYLDLYLMHYPMGAKPGDDLFPLDEHNILIYKRASPDDPSLLEEPRIKAIPEKYNKTPAQVLLRFHIQRNVIVVANCFDFELSENDMKMMSFTEKRAFSLSWASTHKVFPLNSEY